MIIFENDKSVKSAQQVGESEKDVKVHSYYFNIN